nr:PREDICTED: olfactory receptor 51D1 [Bos mutus]
MVESPQRPKRLATPERHLPLAQRRRPQQRPPLRPPFPQRSEAPPTGKEPMNGMQNLASGSASPAASLGNQPITDRDRENPSQSEQGTGLRPPLAHTKPRLFIPAMTVPNGTLVQPACFLLVGIPGLGPDTHFWLALPLCCMYASASLGNLAIILIIRVERRLHEPMYLFLAMLSTIDLVLSSVTMPKMVSLFLTGVQEIEFNACLAQMFLIHALSAMESAILLAMAFDRFVAICHPLQHASVLTRPMVAKIGLAALTRGFVLFFPLPFILKRLSYCRKHTVTHSFCLHQDIMKLSCTDTTVNVVYGLFIILSVMGVDSLFIGFSYILILRAVLELSSQGAALKAFNTCISHLCAVLVFYVPLIGLSVVHRLSGPTSLLHVIMANIYLLLPPVVNPIVYGAKTKEIRSRVFHIFSQNGR